MSESSSGRNIVEVLAEQFVQRHRAGERPALSEYTSRHPEHAAEIEDLFPALLMMENLKPHADESPLPHAASDLERDQLGDYRIIREVGRGGMGIVYEAEQISLGRHVALKVLPRELLSNAKHRARFERESRAAGRLHHTNIVPVFGVGEEDGQGYYVMQYIQGRPLDDVLDELKQLVTNTDAPDSLAEVQQRNLSAETLIYEARSAMENPSGSNVSGSDSSNDTPLRSGSSIVLPGSESEDRSSGRQTYWHSVAQIGIQVADALSYAHGQGVLHRDIKPANLLLDMRGTVWVTDFGLAMMDDDRDLTRTGDILGTLRYMAPETFKGRTDARSEIYSLGLTLYELLGFRPAFDQTNRNMLVEQVMAARVESLGKLNPEIPHDLQIVVHKAIDSEPEHRYQTAQELSDDLQRIIHDEPVRARRILPHERFRRWARRNKSLAASLSTVAFLLVALACGSMFAVGQLNDTVGDLTVAQRDAESKAEQLGIQSAEADRQRKRSEHHLYAARIALAQNQLTSADAVNAQRSLAEAVAEDDETDHRGWEWHYLARWSDSAARTFYEIDSGRSHDVAFSPDGKLLASSSGGDIYAIEQGAEPTPGVIVIRDFATGRILHRLNGHSDVVSKIAFSPDGKTLASAGHDKLILFWDVETGAETNRINASNQLPNATPRDLKYSFRGDHLAAMWKAWDQPAELWGVGSLYSLTKRLPVLELDARNMEFSHDGSQFYYVPKSQSGTIRVRRLNEEQDERLFPSWLASGRLWGLTASSAGSYLAAVNEHRILIWNLKKKALVHSLPVSEGTDHIVFSSDERLLCTYGHANYAQIWESKSGRKLATLLGTSKVTGAAFSPDNRWLAASSDSGLIQVFSAQREPRATRYRSPWQLGAMSFGAEGNQLRFAGPTTTIASLDTKTGGHLFRYKLPATETELYPRGDFVFDSNASRMAAPRNADPRTVTVWESESGLELLSTGQHPGRVTSAAFSHDGKLLATACLTSDSAEVRIWNAGNGQIIRTLDTPYSHVLSLAFCPTGYSIAAGSGSAETGGVTIWALKTGKQLFNFHRVGRIQSLAFSPNGERLAAANYSTSRVSVWNAKQGQPIGDITEIRSVSDLAWSPDGTRLAAIGYEAHVHLFDGITLHELIVLRSMAAPTGTHGFTPRVAFSPSGSRIAGVGPRSVTTVWDAGDGYVNRELAKLVEEAGAYLENEQYNLAFKTATQAVACENSNRPAQQMRADAWNILAECHQQRGNIAAADNALAQGRTILTDLAVSEAAEFTPNMHAGPTVPHAIQIATAVEFDDLAPPPELAKLSAVIKTDPKNATTLFERGRLHEQLGYDDEALEDYTSALQANAGLAQAWRRRAHMHLHRQEIDKTLGDLARYLELEPNDTQAYLTRGDLYVKLEKWQEAVNDYSRAITPETQDARLIAQRGDVFKQLERWEEAVADWKRAIELKPKDPDFVYQLLYERAQTLDWILQRNEEAEVAWSWVIEARPDNSAYPLMNRANIYRQFGQFDKAMADLDRAVEQRRGQYKSLVIRGGFLASLGQWTRAAADLANSFKRPLPAGIRYDVYLHHALLQLMAADSAGYQSGLTKLDEHLAEKMDAQQALWLVYATVAGPDAITQEHHDRLLGILEKHLAEKDAAWKPRLTAALHYRAGMFQEAADLLDQNRKGPDWPAFHFIAAMAHHKLGNHEPARKRFKGSTDLITQKEAEVDGPAVPPRQNWRTWAIFKSLQREAAALIQQQ